MSKKRDFREDQVWKVKENCLTGEIAAFKAGRACQEEQVGLGAIAPGPAPCSLTEPAASTIPAADRDSLYA